MLVEASIALAFYLLAIPFGFLSRRVKRSGLDPYRKWPLFLGVVHTPVLPLIVFVRLAHPALEYEAALVAILLLGHLTGVLAYGRRAAVPAAAPARTVERAYAPLRFWAK